MVVFGDSLSDTGNTLAVIGRPNLPMYSRGRWTNGADNTADPRAQTAQSGWTGLWHDRLADVLDMPRAAPSRVNSGTNFAHGGATAADGTSSFVIQNTGAQVADFLSRQGSGAIPADKLYVLWAGGNNIRDRAKAANPTPDALRATAQTAVDNLTSEIQLLSQHVPQGQRVTIVWPNLPPLESIPDFAGSAQAVRDAVAAGTSKFKDAQDIAITALAASAPNIDIKKFDVYSLFGDLVAGRLSWTPTNTTQNIVTAGNFSGIVFNPQRNAAVPGLPNPDQFLYWDEVHPTAQVHKVLGEYAYQIVPAPGALSLAALAGLLAARRRR